MKKNQKDQGKQDLKSNLIKTIEEYEALAKQPDIDEQQKQHVERLIQQMKRELDGVNNDVVNASVIDNATTNMKSSSVALGEGVTQLAVSDS